MSSHGIGDRINNENTGMKSGCQRISASSFRYGWKSPSSRDSSPNQSRINGAFTGDDNFHWNYEMWYSDVQLN